MLRPHTLVTALIIRPAVLAGMAALLTVAVAATGKSDRWPFGLVAVAGVAGLWESAVWIYRLLCSPLVRQGTGRYLQLCALWMINLIVNLTLLNLAAHLAYPGTFRSAGGSASLLDMLYFTLMTFASGGYGDVVPVTPLGKSMAMITTLCGFFYGSTLCAAILQQISMQRRD